MTVIGQILANRIVFDGRNGEELLEGRDLGVVFCCKELGFIERDARDGRIWVGDGFGVGLPSTWEGAVRFLVAGEVLPTRSQD